jgi:hypothetical protein
MYIPDDEYKDILSINRQLITDGIFGAATQAQVESSALFARYLHRVGITPANYWVFLRVLESNNKYVVDALVGDNDPRLLFSIVKPNGPLLDRAFKLITLWHPGQIYGKVLQAILGIVEYCFHDPDEGLSIHPLDISDLNNIGKYLDADKDQFEATNAIVLDVLDWISRMGAFSADQRKSLLAKHAYHIRMGYFDKTKKLPDIIPSVLLVRLDREKTEVKPSSDFLEYADRSRDNRG